MNILIAICTHKRPEGLKRLLASLDAYLPTDNRPDILVVDNAPDHMPEVTRDLCKDVKRITEPHKGYVYPRNAALKYALEKNYETMIFLDDDEYITEGWYHEITKPTLYKNYDYIAGPVYPDFEKEKLAHAPWLIKTNIYAPSGTEGPVKIGKGIATNNILIKLNNVRDHNLRFDEKYNDIGGEDVAFFFKLQKLGAKGYYAANAKVMEVLSEDRYSYEYFKNRMRNSLNAGVLAYTEAFGVFKTLRFYFPRIIAHFIFGLYSFFTRNKYKTKYHLFASKFQFLALKKSFCSNK